MNRIAVNLEVLRWAIKRADLDLAGLQGDFPQLAALETEPAQRTMEGLETEAVQMTMRELEQFAKKAKVPFGFLFLRKPPRISLPIADFRTLEGRHPQGISPDLMDTIYLMQRRQDWLREEKLEIGAQPLSFVGTARLSVNPAALGQEMRRTLDLEDDWAQRAPTWTEAVGGLRSTIEALGVMAVINGVVGNNTSRKLEVREFRGFALCDPHAPLIFVNGADTKSAQMFTLAHELAHLWLGNAGEGLSGFERLSPGDNEVEQFCNRAAAEFLVPAAELEAEWPHCAERDDRFEKLARRFKVSPIVIGRRAMDLDFIGPGDFRNFYDEYTQGEHHKKQDKGQTGGDFFNIQHTRVGRLFASCVIRAAKEGRIGFKEACDLCGLHGDTFNEYARKLGFWLP